MESISALTDAITALALLIDVTLRAYTAVRDARRRQAPSEDGAS
ncbi:hypothetical protein GCM10010521_38710 [Streptomyces rameus]|uniref:Uncharacterized protein n=1 Tax=Streptomyces rameus TaxID=68261 RepID=A0ABP6NIH0_9ACTN